VDERVSTALGVLGPLVVVRNGERVELGSPQQRRLVAVLAVNANRVVSSDRLVDVLWGDAPPSSAVHTLHGLVSRLRASLGEHCVETNPPGYRLRVANGELDALRFEELVRVGLAAADDSALARRAFDDALSLWRGLPYEEFASEEFATAAVTRLVELHNRLVEERAAALLELTDPGDVIPELVVHIASEPFRERLRALLMLALARAGRPVEALRAYDEFRTFLADEVGVVPSPGLQALNDDIVRQCPEVSWADSPPAPAHNLPAPVDAFVGRRAELVEVHDALSESRLVTLIGPGGSGKTRLALEAASAELRSYRDGVWFVSLAVTASGERVVPLVAAALGVADAAGEPIDDTLEEWQRHRELLLVLDNCEHVLGAVADFAERYLSRCAGLRILATSREGLDARGERALATPPLSFDADLAQAGSSDAVELFLVRAAAAAPGFDVEAADVAEVAAICRRLDGLPLAIELAAARLRALSLEQIATRLDDRFRLLRAGARTLEAVVAWSYDLLTDVEREVFARLAVFPADFSLEAAEQVVADADVDEAAVLDLVTRLVEKSLVTTVVTEGSLRYRMLETIHEYARRRLVETGETDRWCDRLLAWAMTRVEYVEVSLRRPAQDAALQSVTADSVSLRAAMEWAITRGDHLAALRIAATVPMGFVGERRQLITSLLQQLGASVQALYAGHAYSALGTIAIEQGDWTAASEFLATAAEQFQRAGSGRHAAWANYFGVVAAWGAGDVAEADALVRQAIDGFRTDDDVMGLGNALTDASLLTTDLDEAARLAAEADEILRAMDSPISFAHNVEGRGIIAYDRGELADAATFVAEAVEIYRHFESPGCTAHALESAAVIIGEAGQRETATELLGAADELRRTSGAGHKPWEIRARHSDIDDRIAPASRAAREAAFAAGRRHTVESAARVALDALASVPKD